MSKLSDKTREKLKDAILSVLYDDTLNPLFTHAIANEIIRDKELTLKLLLELKEKGFVKQVQKDSRGRYYQKRRKWILPNNIIQAFDKKFE